MDARHKAGHDEQNNIGLTRWSQLNEVDENVSKRPPLASVARLADLPLRVKRGAQPVIKWRPKGKRRAGENPTRRTSKDPAVKESYDGFLAQIMHQPFGEMSPSTFLQDDGAWNSTQSSHFLPSFGSG